LIIFESIGSLIMHALIQILLQRTPIIFFMKYAHTLSNKFEAAVSTPYSLLSAGFDSFGELARINRGGLGRPIERQIIQSVSRILSDKSLTGVLAGAKKDVLRGNKIKGAERKGHTQK
jgi:hypothetical protein